MSQLLTRLGFHPQREDTVRGELWYLSPFRQETTPSFKVHLANNVWYDFGLAGGGNVIDFARRYFQLGFTEALRKLATLEGGLLPLALATPPRVGPSFPTRPPAAAAPQNCGAADDSAPVLRPLTNRALIAYLARRGIPVEVARPYVQEMHSTRGGKSYFALAFANASGGYELRNPYFKGTQAPKDITCIEGTPAVVALFEGFLDFLSALTCEALAEPRPTVIVLNSAALREKALRSIHASSATTVVLYFDHDPSGRDLTVYFQQRLTGLTVRDRSDRYAGYKDFNAWLAAERSCPQ